MDTRGALDAPGAQGPNNQVAATREFFARRRLDGESGAEYLNAIRLLAARCDFGDDAGTLVKHRFAAEFPGDVTLFELEFTSRTKRSGESRQQFESALRKLAAKCNFGAATDLFVSLLVSREFPGDIPTPSVVAEDTSENIRRKQTTEEKKPENLQNPPNPKKPPNSMNPEKPQKQQKVQKPQKIQKTNPSWQQPQSGDDRRDEGLLIRYKKLAGAADGAGESFECKMLTLVFLRMLSAGHEFQLASNMEAAGLFDDIVIRHRKNFNVGWKVSYMQLKHKKNRNKSISKAELTGCTGDFSLVRYCDSYETMKSSNELHSFGEVIEQKFIIFTNASISDSIVDRVDSDSDMLLITGGKVEMLKAGNLENPAPVYQELCEWVDFKQALTDLQDLVAGLNEQEITNKILDGLENVQYTCKQVTSLKSEMVKYPTSAKLDELLNKLAPVRDKETYSSFLDELQMYTNQAHESELDAMINEQLSVLWKCNVRLEADAMFNSLLNCVQSWWKKDSYYLTQDSTLWLGVIKAQTEFMSKSTIDRLTKTGAEFVKSSLDVLLRKIPPKGIVKIRVDSHTAASSLRVHQALRTKFPAIKNVLQVNLSSSLDRLGDVLAAWATKWCRVLVLECDQELSETNARQTSEDILKILETENNEKLLVLIETAKHNLRVQPRDAKSCTSFEDKCEWNDLTDETKQRVYSARVVLNFSQSRVTLLDLVDRNKEVVKKANLEAISEFISENLNFGKELYEESKFFVARRLLDSNKTFAVNSVHDVRGNVLLVVAEPGMGKSTLMTHLAKQAKAEDPTAWIVHVKLNDCSKYLKLMDPDTITNEAAKKFVEHFALSPGNGFERLVFRSLEHKLFVFIDGVDEVSPSYERQIFTLLKILKDFKFVKLCVASRAVFENQLEDVLGAKAHHLDHFSNEDQAEFFNKVWEDKFPEQPSNKRHEAADRFLSFLRSSFTQDNQLLGIPLIAFMVAEMFKEQALEVIQGRGKFEMNDTLNMMSLYKEFVRKKFDRFCNEKRNMPNREESANVVEDEKSMDSIYHNHCLAALRVLFNLDEIAQLKFKGKEKFEGDLIEYLKVVSNGEDKIGIIINVIKGIPYFIHHSFAEYFAATWLADNFDTNRELAKRITFDLTRKFLGEMFHRVLAENCHLHLAVLNRDVKESKKLLRNKYDVNELDAGGRTALHLAVLLSATDPHEDCVAIVETLVQHKARVDIADTIAGWTPVRYTEEVRSWLALEIFLDKGIKRDAEWPRPDPDVMLDAARDASVAVVRYLAEERRGDLKCRGPKDESMVHVAAEGGNVETLEYLVGKGLSLKDKDNEWNTALHFATNKDSVTAVRFLLDQGLDLTAVNSDGLTAFHLAAKRGAYEVMDVLLENRASAKVTQSDALSKNQCNAFLLCAAFAGDLETVKHLVELGVHYRHHQNDKGNSAVWFAMYRTHYDLMHWLLLRETEEGDTPLHAACRLGESEVVAFLISQPDADIAAKGWKGQTPLHDACWGLRSEAGVTKLLLDHGAAIDCRDEYGDTPLHSASSWGSEQDLKWLLSHGANIDGKNKESQTPLHSASEHSNFDAIALLLEKDADVKCCDVYGETALHKAVASGRELGVKLLLSRDAKVDARNNRGWTPLHCASAENPSAIKLLLAHGADSEICDKYGNTPLHVASSEGVHVAVELLLRHGARLDARNNLGETPLEAAKRASELKYLNEWCKYRAVLTSLKSAEFRQS